MKNRIQLSSFYLMIFIFFASCLEHKNEIEITIINEMQPCEENNIFYRIISDVKEDSIAYDSIIFLILNNEIRNNENYSLLFPSESNIRYKFKVKGYYINGTMGYNNSYGCVGSKIFQINKIISWEDVTLIENFKISNN